MPPPTSPDPGAGPRPALRRRWRWVRAILKWSGLLVLVLLIFHRPLLRWGVRWGAERAANSQDLALQWTLGGSITGGVQADAVSVSGGAGHWLPRATVGNLSASYDLVTLLRRGPGDFLEQVTIHDAEVELDLRKLPQTAENKPPEPAEKSGPPELVWPGMVDLKNISATVTLADGTRWEVRNLTLQTGKGQPERFSCDEIRQIPGGVHLKNLQAGVQIRDRRLVIRDFGLPEDVTLRSFAADLSKFAAGEIGLKVELESGPARGSVDARLTSLQQSTPQLNADVRVAGLTHRQIPGLPPQLAFHSGNLNLHAEGGVQDAHALQVKAVLSDAAGSWDGWAADRLALDLRLEKGTATLTSLDIARGANRIAISGRADLPQRWENAANLTWETNVNADLPEPQSLSPQPLPVMAKALLKASASGKGGALSGARATLALTDISREQIRIPRADLVASADSGKAVVESLVVSLGGANTLRAAGQLGLTGAQPAELEWKLDCPDAATVLGSLGVALKTPVNGALKSAGKVQATLQDIRAQQWQHAHAEISASGDALRFGEADAGTFSVEVHAANGFAEVKSLRIAPGPDNSLTASARMPLRAPWPVEANAALQFDDLAALAPLFRAAGMEPPVTAGRIALQASASGTPEQPFWKGTATLRAEKVHSPSLPDPVSAQSDLASDGQWLTISTLRADSGPWRGELSGRVSTAQAEVSRISVHQGAAELLTGRALLPFAALKEAPDAPPMDVRIETRALDIAPFSRGAAEGKLDAKIALQGTLAKPDLDVDAALSGARAVRAPGEIARSSARVKLSLRNDQLSLGGQMLQPPLQPLTFSAEAPVQLSVLRSDPRSALDIPFQARASMARSDLAFLRQFAADTVRHLEGSLSLNATVSGTARKPAWDGDVLLALPEVSFISASLPGVKDATAGLRVRDNVVQPDISALLAGGKVNIGGTVTLTDFKNPDLAVTLTAREALAMRDRNTSLRANADLTLTGPLRTAKLAGTVEAVRGRVFKELEFLPLSLPDDLPPPPPAVHSGSSTLSFGGVAAGMNFDVAIRTKDPIRLMGNIMSGAVIADAHLGGTGAAPLLTGSATFDDTRLRLPFSQMKLVRGKATIDPAKPMEPQLDIRGESRVGEYSVTLYVFGSAFDPQLRFVSVPPLSEPDIAVLLATGAPLAGSAQQAGAEATGRALFLLASQTYRKMLGKTGPRNEEPPKLHLSFNPSSGLMGTDGAAILADYELTDRLRLSGSAAQSGNTRVMLSWLIRFGEPLPPPSLRKP